MELSKQDIDAFNQVKTAVTSLRAEYDGVCESIAATEKHLTELPLLPVPVGDLKAAVLDLVDACGKAYLAENVKPAIASLATNMAGGSSADVALIGKPLRYKELQAAIAGTGGTHSRPQLLTAFDKHQFNDVALYAFFGALVKAGLTAAMNTMTEEDFGYDKLLPEQVGTDRATRTAAIEAAQAELIALRASKKTLADNLFQLGVVVEG